MKLNERFNIWVRLQFGAAGADAVVLRPRTRVQAKPLNRIAVATERRRRNIAVTEKNIPILCPMGHARPPRHSDFNPSK